MSECLGRMVQPYSINLDAIADLSVTSYGLGFLTQVDAAAARTYIGVDPAGSGVTSITGTANQVIASDSTGAVTLSLPQNYHTGATPQLARLGLGATPSATALLRLQWTNVDAERGIILNQVSSDTFPPLGAFLKARGTPGSESAVLSGDTLGNFSFRGWDGSSYTPGGSFRIVASENWGASNHGAFALIFARASGAGGDSEAARFTDTLALFAGSMQTAAPSGSSAVPWLLGAYTADPSDPPTQGGVKVTINGVVKTLATLD